jgi:hypothetical protein
LFTLLPGLSGARDTEPVIASVAQSSTDPQYGPRRNQQSPDEAKIERDMAKQRNKDRQQKLKQDTDKLLKLATELKQYVDKSNDQILSVEVLKKTDEIEKLARSVRDKMKAGSYDGVEQ